MTLPILLLGCSTAPEDAEVAAAVLGASPGDVRAYRAAGDGYSGEIPTPIHRFTSLDAYVEGDRVYLAGLSHGLVPSAQAERFPSLFVTVVETGDLSSWTAHSWRVEAAGSSLIDPALVAGPEGRELWFVQVDGTGDPAAGGRTSTVVRTHWTGDRFAAAEVVFTGTGLVDPSPVYTSAGWDLFCTHDRHEIVEITEANPRPVTVAGNLTVPHARRVGASVRLTAQSNAGGRASPVLLTRLDGGGWSEPRPLLPNSESRACTSPATVELPSGGLLFCAEDRDSPPADRGQAGGNRESPTPPR